MFDPTSLVASRLRALRLEAGRTQKEMAEQLKMTDSAAAKIERGERSMRIDELLELAAWLGVSPLGLLAMDDDDQAVIAGFTVDGRQLRQWLRGEEALPGAPDDGDAEARFRIHGGDVGFRHRHDPFVARARRALTYAYFAIEAQERDDVDTARKAWKYVAGQVENAAEDARARVDLVTDEDPMP